MKYKNKVLKLKKWVEILLLILAFPMFMMMIYNPEINIYITILGFIGFNLFISIIVEYGTLFNKLTIIIGKFNNK